MGPLSKLDIRNTLSALQHDFCTLWNEISRETPNHGPESVYICYYVLQHIRHLYIALHQGTDASTPYFSPFLDDPLLYPLCNIPGHHLILISTTGETTHPLTITSTPSNPPDAVLNTIAPSSVPAVSSFPASTEDDSCVHFESSLHDVFDPTPTIAESSRRSPINVETSHPAATPHDLIT
jgi:hypothetical protein